MTNLRLPAEHGLRAFVLAGGLGLRLRSVVADRPKSLATVGGRPFLDYVLCQLSGNRIRRVTLCTGHGADAIRAFVADGSRWGLEVTESRETEPLGTAGALRSAWDTAAGDEAFVLNGDSFFDVPLGLLLERHRSSGAAATMAVRRLDSADRFGSMALARDGSVLSFSEKGSIGPALINGGVYLLRREVLAVIAPGAPASLERDVFPGLAGVRPDGTRGQLQAVPWAGFFIDIGVPADLERLDRDPGPVVGALAAMGAC